MVQYFAWTPTAKTVVGDGRPVWITGWDPPRLRSMQGRDTTKSWFLMVVWLGESELSSLLSLAKCWSTCEWIKDIMQFGKWSSSKYNFICSIPEKWSFITCAQVGFDLLNFCDVLTASSLPHSFSLIECTNYKVTRKNSDVSFTSYFILLDQN